MFGSRLGTKPKIFFHGTDEEAARQIQAQGFVVRPGHGGLLGRGVYCTSTLDKAMEYAKGPYGGIVLELLVDLGRCKELQPNDPMMTSWQSQYDSAWAPFSARDPRDTSKQENCVKDPKKIKVVRAIGRNMGLLHQGGYDIVDGKLIRKFDPQEARRKQEEAARQQIAAQAKAQAEAEAKRKQEEAARQKAAVQARAKAEADAQRQVGARQNAAAGGMAFPVFKSSGSMFSATAKYCRNCGQGTAKDDRETCKQCGAAHWISAAELRQVGKAVSTPEAEKKLREAAAKGETAEVQRLLSQGADPNGRDSNGNTALELAKDKDMLECLRAGGAKMPDITDKNKNALLLRYAENGAAGGVIAVLQAGANTDHRDPYNNSKWTPLHEAAYRGHTSTVDALIQGRADVEAVDSDYKCTPLHLAADRGRTSTVDTLIQGRADVNAVNMYGKTPLYYAKRKGKTEVARLLEAAGGRRG